MTNIKYVLFLVLTSLMLNSAKKLIAEPVLPQRTIFILPVTLDTSIRRLVIANWDSIDIKQALTIKELKLLKKDIRENKVIIRTIIVKDNLDLQRIAGGRM